MAQSEKRRSTRRRIQVPVLCWESGDEDRNYKGKEIITKDLSGDGIAFFSQKIYPINAFLFISIYLPNEKVPVSCKLNVVSIEAIQRGENYIIGACFSDLSAKDRIRIATAVEKMDLYVLLESAIAGGASDLHLTVGKPPKVRVRGRIMTMGADVIEAGQVEAMLYPLITQDKIEYFEKHKELDFAFSPDINSRFRVNMHSQKGYVEAVLRSIPTTIRNFANLGLIVKTMERFSQKNSGLFLIAGMTGAGKTTTMMSMVNFMNQTQERVVITIEDPIEFMMPSKQCIIKQRELGSDTLSYASAIKHAIRQDPDVICIGEIVDEECLLAALRAAETGHLVITTVHSPTTTTAIERTVNLVPPEHARSIRDQLASSLIGVMFQKLVPHIDGVERVVATEMLLNNTATKHLIRTGNYKQIDNVLQTGRAHGMHLLNDNLNDLYEKGVIDRETMKNHAKSDDMGFGEDEDSIDEI